MIRLRSFVRGALCALGLAGVVLSVDADRARAQISFFPPVVALEAGGRSGWLELMSASRTPTDLELSLHFSVPLTDSLGAVRLADGADLDPLTSRSAVPLLRFGPDRIRLEAGGTQRVRFVAPAGPLPPGEYWARLRIASRPAAAALGTALPGDALRAAVQANVNVFIPVFVRVGRPVARPRLDSLTAHLARDTLIVRGWLGNEGDGAALGLVRVEATDALGTVVASTARHVAVYTHQSPVFRIPLPAGTAPPSLVRLVFSDARPDLPDDMRLGFDAVTATVAPGIMR